MSSRPRYFPSRTSRRYGPLASGQRRPFLLGARSRAYFIATRKTYVFLFLYRRAGLSQMTSAYSSRGVNNVIVFRRRRHVFSVSKMQVSPSSDSLVYLEISILAQLNRTEVLFLNSFAILCTYISNG